MNNESQQRENKIPGIAIAGMLFLWALLFLASASYFDATGDSRVAWYAVGAVVAVVALAGALTELAQVPGKEALSDFSVALVLAAVAVGFGLPPVVWKISGPFNGIMKGGALIFALFTALGLASGVGKMSASANRQATEKIERNRRDTVLALILGALALTTAGLNLWAAIAARH